MFRSLMVNGTAAATIRGRLFFSRLRYVRLLFGGSYYSSKYGSSYFNYIIMESTA